MIKINETMEIPFYKIESVGRSFPLIRPIVKFGTVGRISNYSVKLEKLEVGFNRLCKMLRHPEVLQEIARHNFSIKATVSNDKRSIQGDKLIEKFGVTYFSGGFEIYIRHLRTGLGGTMGHGNNRNSKEMTIADWVMQRSIIVLVEFLGHELAHAYGLQDGGGAYRFQSLIGKMYKRGYWEYEEIVL